jgi:hypothetical protein
MSWIRFSLLSLMAGVGYTSMILAALTTGSRLCAHLLFNVTLGAFLVGLLGAIYQARERRAFWVGFTIVGWIYLTLAFGPWCKDNIAPKLVTHNALVPLPESLVELHAAYHAERGFTPRRDPSGCYLIGPNAVFAPTATWDVVQETVDSATAMLCAVLGGFVAAGFWRRGVAETTARVA